MDKARRSQTVFLADTNPRPQMETLDSQSHQRLEKKADRQWTSSTRLFCSLWVADGIGCSSQRTTLQATHYSHKTTMASETISIPPSSIPESTLWSCLSTCSCDPRQQPRAPCWNTCHLRIAHCGLDARADTLKRLKQVLTLPSLAGLVATPQQLVKPITALGLPSRIVAINMIARAYMRTLRLMSLIGALRRQNRNNHSLQPLFKLTLVAFLILHGSSVRPQDSSLTIPSIRRPHHGRVLAPSAQNLSTPAAAGANLASGSVKRSA